MFGILRSRILTGEFEADERLPSELELTREFGLSRATVRQTLSKLETEGYARRVARRGVFASTPTASTGWIVQDTQGFLDSQLSHGRTGIATKVIDASFVVPPAHVAEGLRLGSEEQVFALERVRSLKGRTAMFSTNWFPSEVGSMMSAASDVLDGTGSVDSTLRRAGFVTAGAHRVIRALRPPKVVAGHLGIGAQHPVMQVQSWSWDQNDRRFDYYETWVLTDVVPLEVMVAAS
ncbi:MAG: GntR family transcriptional regulator [Microbacteriaceae bacterium]|nr:MAG: GntR family transcriptional regulator [Microbacteriaceae bacterium]